MQIEAAVLREPHGRFVLETVDLSEPNDDELLVRIVASGICHTDLAVRDQHVPLPLPAVLGHEGAGEVIAIGRNVTRFAVGDHVVLSYGSCGICSNCMSGKSPYCSAFLAYNVGTRRPDGSCTHHQNGKPLTSLFFYQSSFATYAITHHRNAVKVAKHLPLEVLAPLGCGIQTGAGAVINCLRPEAGSSIAIFGMGAVGLAALMAATVVGCTTIVVVDVQEARLDLARQLGATHTANASRNSVVDAVRAGCQGVDYAIEASGVPAVMSQAFDVLNGTGTAIVLGVAPAGSAVSIDVQALLNGKTLRGAIEGESIPSVFIPQLIALWEAGRFPFDRLARLYDFADINQAIEDCERGRTVKAVVRMGA